MQKGNERSLPEYERLVAEGKYVEAVIGFIEDTMAVSFAEIDGWLSSQIESIGPVQVECLTNETLILWAGMSKFFANIMDKVLKCQKVETQPTSHLTCLADSAALNLSIASKVYAYITLHWLPVPCNPRSE